MPRVKRGPIPRRRHKRVMAQTKGYWGGRKNRYRQAVRSLRKAWQYAYIGRKQRKREFRRLWVTRINAACHENGLSYSKLIFGLNRAGVELNRKMLAEMAVRDSASFKKLTELASSPT